MKEEKVFKRDNGTNVKIIVTLTIEAYMGAGVEWKTEVFVKKWRRRKWYFVDCDIDEEYWFRSLDQEGREKALRDNKLKYITPEEEYFLKSKIWKKLRPKLITNTIL